MCCILRLQTHQQRERLQAEIPSIHKIAQEYEVLLSIRMVRLPRALTPALPHTHPTVLAIVVILKFLIIVRLP